MRRLSDDQLFASTNQHLSSVPACGAAAHYLQASVLNDFVHLRQRLAERGYSLFIASSFRSVGRQLQIWNDKANGVRPVLNDHGEVIDLSKLTARERMFAILRWSALPGASRHHWGTDLDVYDGAALAAGESVQLTPAEVAEAGPMGPIHAVLDELIALGESYGFSRPYAVDCGGVAPERWHLSHAQAQEFQEALSEYRLRCFIEKLPELAMKTEVLEHLGEIYQRFVRVW